MLCPQCKNDTKVIDSRKRKKGLEIFRRRECSTGHRFSTSEKSLTEGDLDILFRINKLEKVILEDL